ncbi:MAG: DUF4349 domain-containing protein [Gemmataceae bacterium]
MRRVVAVGLAVLCLTGCGEQRVDFAGAAKDKQAARDGKNADRPDLAARPERKIIYTARVEAVVEDLDDAEASLHELLQSTGGYIAKSERTGQPGARHGTWTLRIPVAKFDAALAALAKLGEVRRNTLDSDDITDRYFDLQAEVTNLEVREKALRKLYEEKIAGSKLTDLLDVDRELTKVRGEINQRKGQLQRWDKETAFATVHLDLHDRRGYVPPTAPAFTTTVGRTFEASITLLVSTGKAIVLIAVALAPWLAVLVVVTLPLALLLRRRRPLPPPLPAVGEGGKET